MRGRQTTINDVAKKAGVSIKTVSRVLNHEPNVRAETREKVLQASRELDYSPNLSARRLASNRAFVIGLLYDNPQSDYVTAVQDGSLLVCRRLGYNILIHPCSMAAPELAEEIRGLYRQSTVDGFILTPPISDHGLLLEALSDVGCPFVRVSQKDADGEFPWVSVDDEESSAKMTEHLISLGHRRIAFIMGHPEHGSSRDRLHGFKAALAAHGISEDGVLIEQGFYDFDSGYAAAQKLLDADPRPTAVFASNDHMAVGVLRAAGERHLRVPDDLSVCGFDDAPMARYIWPALTTVRQPVKDVAARATEVLLSGLRGDPPLKKTHRLFSELIRRQSTGPCPVQEG